MSKLFRVEYYLKGMKISAQKIIMNKLNNGFSDFYRDFVEIFNDNMDGKGYNRMYDTMIFRNKEDVDEFISSRVEYLEIINKLMTDNERNPLFPEPTKLVESWKLRDRLMEFLPEEVLNQEFNCESFKAFQPINIMGEHKQEDCKTPR